MAITTDCVKVVTTVGTIIEILGGVKWHQVATDPTNVWQSIVITDVNGRHVGEVNARDICGIFKQEATS